MALLVKNPPGNARDFRDSGFHLWVGKSPGVEMGTHSSILAPHPQKKWLKEVSGPTIFFSFEKLRTRIQTPQYFD